MPQAVAGAAFAAFAGFGAAAAVAAYGIAYAFTYVSSAYLVERAMRALGKAQ